MTKKHSSLERLKQEIDIFLDSLVMDIGVNELEEKSRKLTNIWLRSGWLQIGEYYDKVIDIVSDFDAMSQVSNESREEMLSTLIHIKEKRT